MRYPTLFTPSLTKALAYNLQAISALVKGFMAQASKSLD
jgi:hypothetical protein